MNNLLQKLSDEQLMQEISPNRNCGIYLLGHLTTVHDLMLPLLQLEDPIFPDLQPVYVDSPDRSIAITPLATQLRAQWVEVNERLFFILTSCLAMTGLRVIPTFQTRTL